MKRPPEPAITTPPLASVITPCYNAAPFVAETIASVQAQTFPRVEHIVVDDASTDDSWQVIQRHSQYVTAIRLPENRGGSHARNRGAEIARGEFLMFLDADDVIARHTLAAMVAAIRESGDVAVCRWQWLQQMEGKWQKAPTKVLLPDPAGDPLRDWLTGRAWAAPCAVLWRREAYDHVGGWDEELTLNDDGDLMMRAILDGVRLVVAEQGESFYRSHGSARLSVSMNAFSEPKLRSQCRVLEKVEATLIEQGRLTTYADALGIAYLRTALLAFRAGSRELGRECRYHGEALAGRRSIAPTFAGKVLTFLLGMERKENVANALAQAGIATRGRRRALVLRQKHTGPGESDV
ncbi:MAG: glycosyltransferase [Gemmatimonadetes bacterium]|nr:glycosyltransferase [Gemmatimonadota bacterium]